MALYGTTLDLKWYSGNEIVQTVSFHLSAFTSMLVELYKN